MVRRKGWESRGSKGSEEAERWCMCSCLGNVDKAFSASDTAKSSIHRIKHCFAKQRRCPADQHSVALCLVELFRTQLCSIP
jgi:hypothetical protein